MSESDSLSLILEERLNTLAHQIETGFRDVKGDIGKVDGRLKELNGTVRAHEMRLIKNEAERTAHENRLKVLESWRNSLMTSLIKGAAQGVTVVIVITGVIFGIGKATGWW